MKIKFLSVNEQIHARISWIQEEAGFISRIAVDHRTAAQHEWLSWAQKVRLPALWEEASTKPITVNALFD